MITILQMALAVCQNAIPAGGVVFRGWTPAIALTLYWCENLVASILIASRIAIHRRLTRRKGHYRLQINTQDDGARRAAKGPRPTFLAEFLQISLGFTLVHGVFLAALLAIVVKSAPDRSQVAQGLFWMVPVQVAGFLLDLRRLRHWPFAELKHRADHLVGRIGLLQLSILGGMLISAFSARPRALFAVFGLLKTLSDLAGLIPYNPAPPAEAPRWFLRLADLFGRGKHWKTGQDAATWWRETTLAERRRAEEDEQILEPPRRASTS